MLARQYVLWKCVSFLGITSTIITISYSIIDGNCGKAIEQDKFGLGLGGVGSFKGKCVCFRCERCVCVLWAGEERWMVLAGGACLVYYE